MPRAKDAPARVGGQIDPYVQRSIQQSKQLAESRLVTAMQEAGATTRTGMQETGAGGRAALQAQTQRNIEASRTESADKRAAEDEIARRDDRKFATTMQEASRDFQAKQAELDRDQQNAIITGDRKHKDEIEKRREALRRFNIELNMDASERNSNAMLSIIKGSLKRETSMEKAKTVLEEEATNFDRDKEVYEKARERIVEAVQNDKRMDLPFRGEALTKAALAGPAMGFTSGFTRVRTGEIKPGTQADPMGVLQDQINKYGGNISIEELAPANINKIEEQIQRGDIKTEDINKTLAALEGMLDAVDIKRKSFDKKSDEFDFWQDARLNIAQMRDGLEGLANSKKKVGDSETETVGSRVQYALGTARNSSLGGRAARMRDLVGGDFTAVFEEMTKSMQIPKLYDITPEMNEYDVEYRTWMNNYLSSRYPELEEGVE
jgi:hypothetical protein